MMRAARHTVTGKKIADSFPQFNHPIRDIEVLEGRHVHDFSLGNDDIKIADLIQAKSINKLVKLHQGFIKENKHTVKTVNYY